MQHPPPRGLKAAIAGIEAGEYSCALVKDGRLTHTDTGRGVAPLVRLYENQRGRMARAACADKIIGRAAAMILHLGGACYVWGAVMSEAAREYLEGFCIPYGYGRLVPVLKNRSGDGTCPIEAAVLHIKTAPEGWPAIKAAIARLMAQNAPKKTPHVQSVDRALAVLELLAEAGGALSLTEISKRSGMPKSTLHGLLATLRGRGFVAQATDTGYYSLAPRIHIEKQEAAT